MTRTLLPALLTASCALLLGACASGPGDRAGARADAQREYEAAMHGKGPMHTLVREGLIPNGEVGRTPEQLARQEASRHCTRINLEALVLDVQRLRWSVRDASGGMLPYERVHLAYRCERSMP